MRLKGTLRKLHKQLLLALALRELLAFWSGHPVDLELWVRLGYHVFKGMNPYSDMPFVLGISFIGHSVNLRLGYPPLFGFVTGAMYAAYTLSNGDRLWYYGLLKQPAIFGDVALALAMRDLLSGLGKRASAERATSFVLFSPMFIILSAIWGMPDSLALALLVLAISKIKELWLPQLLLALSSSLKGLPLIFVPYLLLAAPRSKLAMTAIFTLFFSCISIAPPILLGWDLGTIAQQASGQLLRFAEGLNIWYLAYLMERFRIIGAEALTNLHLVFGTAWIVAVGIVTLLLGIKAKAETPKDVPHTFVTKALLVIVAIYALFRTHLTEPNLLYVLTLAYLCWQLVCQKMMDKEVKLLHLTSVSLIIANNTALIRFLSPVYPGAWDIDVFLNNTSPFQEIRYLAKASGAVLLTFILVSLVHSQASAFRWGRRQTSNLT